MRSTAAEWDSLNRKIALAVKEMAKLKERRAQLREIMSAELRGFPDYRLTPRERQVLAILAARPSYANKEIASYLNITERTVKFHISSLLRKHDVEKRADLVGLPQEYKETIQ